MASPSSSRSRIRARTQRLRTARSERSILAAASGTLNCLKYRNSSAWRWSGLSCSSARRSFRSCSATSAAALGLVSGAATASSRAGHRPAAAQVSRAQLRAALDSLKCPPVRVANPIQRDPAQPREEAVMSLIDEVVDAVQRIQIDLLHYVLGLEPLPQAIAQL